MLYKTKMDERYGSRRNMDLLNQLNRLYSYPSNVYQAVLGKTYPVLTQSFVSRFNHVHEVWYGNGLGCMYDDVKNLVDYMDAYQSQTNTNNLNATAPLNGVWNGYFIEETSETHTGNSYTFWGDLFETGVALTVGPTTITSFDTQFPIPNGNTRYDILKGTEFVECKNYGVGSLDKPFGPTFTKQFEGYLMNISSMNNLKYYFKARYNTATSTEAQFKEKIKNNFKKLFEANNYKIFDAIWNNQALRSSLFPTITGNTTQDEADAKLLFIAMVNSINNSIYNFIQVK